MPSENSRNDSVLYAPTSEVGVKSEHLRDTYFKIECSWYQTAVEGKTYPKGHALVSLDLEFQVLEKAQSRNDTRYKPIYHISTTICKQTNRATR